MHYVNDTADSRTDDAYFSLMADDNIWMKIDKEVLRWNPL